MLGKSLIKAAAGIVGGEVIEDLFQTWLYTGNGSTQTITNGIDLAGEGGLVWCKDRTSANYHYFCDTQRGASNLLFSNLNTANVFDNTSITSFHSSGFSVGTNAGLNTTSNAYASWTFRKAPGFFDVVTFTAGSSTNRRVSHSLGSAPGMIIAKRTDGVNNWAVYHRSLGRSSYIFLNLTSAVFTQSNIWGSTDPTSTDFGIDETALFVNGGTYIAYLFAHDDQIFGEGGNQSVIKCGSFLSQSGNVATVDLGWEPQWVLVKSATGTGSWRIIDNMRGWTLGNDAQLVAEQASAEAASDLGHPTSTGFYSRGSVLAGETGIYIAIRRGPMKTPTSGAEVFSANTSSGSAGTKITTSFPLDMQIAWERNGALSLASGAVNDRLRGISSTDTQSIRHLLTHSTAAENTTSGTGSRDWDNTGFDMPSYPSALNNVFWSFRRAPRFFDVVAYTGTGVARTVAHNLGVAPELMIVKGRNVLSNWSVYHSAAGATQALLVNDPMPAFLNSDRWNNVAPNGDSFTIGTNGDVNASSFAYIAYLFATLPGISKVGSYTGTGTTLNVDCGFASGARLVLIKRTDSTGDWYIWDTARGIIAANDPFLLLNSTAAENSSTDYIDPLSSGFQISSTAPAAINANGGSYIFLAIS